MKKSVIILALMFGACAPGVKRIDEPDDLLSREELVDILTKVSKLEGYATHEYKNVTRFHKVLTNSVDSLLEANDIGQEQYKSSIEYYGSRGDEMTEICNEVLENLNRDMAKALEERGS